MEQDDSIVKAHYEAAVEVYQDVTESPLRRHRTWPATIELLPSLDGRTILDAGCGPGVHAAQLAEQGATVAAVDFSEAMVEHAQANFGKRPGLSFRQLDLREGLDRYDDGQFDVVLCQLVLSHIEELGPVIAEFRRVLDSNGLLAVTGHHPFYDYLLAKTGEYPEAQGAYDLTFDPEITPAQDPPLYQATEPLRIAWAGPDSTPVTYYRRSLSSLFGAITKNGMVIETVREPTPDETFQAEHASPDRDSRGRPPELIAIRARVDDP